MPSSLSCKWRWGPGEGGLAGETQGHVQLQRPGPARERAPARPLPSRGSLTQEASSPDWDSQGHLPVTSSDRVVDPAAEGAGPAVSPGSLPPPDLLSGAHAPAIPARPACTQRQDRVRTRTRHSARLPLKAENSRFLGWHQPRRAALLLSWRTHLNVCRRPRLRKARSALS